MYGFTKIAFSVLAIAGTVFSAVADTNADHDFKIDFTRYSNALCGSAHQLGVDHLHKNACKTFKKAVPFHSFRSLITKESNPHHDKYVCQAIAFDTPNCLGQGFTSEDIYDVDNWCGVPNFAGRSVKVECKPRAITTDTGIPIQLIPTSTFSTLLSTATVTLVPSAKTCSLDCGL